MNKIKISWPLLSLMCVMSFQSNAFDVDPGGNIVIIETETENTTSYCLGFLLDEINVITASQCTINPEKIRVYRSLNDCHKHRDALSVKYLDYDDDKVAEPTTMTLSQPIQNQPNAYTAYPRMNLDAGMDCYFLTKNSTHLDFFKRPVTYHNDHLKVQNGIFNVLTTTSVTFPSSPIPGAILIRRDQATIGISYENGQLYSPMSGFLIPFHTVALEPRFEL